MTLFIFRTFMPAFTWHPLTTSPSVYALFIGGGIALLASVMLAIVYRDQIRNFFRPGVQAQPTVPTNDQLPVKPFVRHLPLAEQVNPCHQDEQSTPDSYPTNTQ